MLLLQKQAHQDGSNEVCIAKIFSRGLKISCDVCQIIILDFDGSGNPQAGAASLIQTITQDVNNVNLNTYFMHTLYHNAVQMLEIQWIWYSLVLKCSEF